VAVVADERRVHGHKPSAGAEWLRRINCTCTGGRACVVLYFCTQPMCHVCRGICIRMQLSAAIAAKPTETTRLSTYSDVDSDRYECCDGQTSVRDDGGQTDTSDSSEAFHRDDLSPSPELVLLHLLARNSAAIFRAQASIQSASSTRHRPSERCVTNERMRHRGQRRSVSLLKIGYRRASDRA
jgi:hypothetical protein